MAPPSGQLVGLARVSTEAQDLQLQRDALATAGCVRIFEKASTRSAERPGLTAALDYLRSGDTLVVWKLDRLGRSVKDVLMIAEDLHDRDTGVKLPIRPDPARAVCVAPRACRIPRSTTSLSTF